MAFKPKFSFLDLFIKVTMMAGICLLLYPTISNKWNEKTQSKIIAGYTQTLEEISEKDYSDMLLQAQEYNEALKSDPDRFDPTEEDMQIYNEVMNVTGDGTMAYIEIPKLNIRLPVYHTVEESVLQIATGHIPGTSLPIGGEGTHSAISGHTGLTSAVLFTHLTDMELGDQFYIQAFNETLAYKVDQIDIVEPDEFNLLHIVEGHDYCTLITCTPYGVNSHRLMVRGERTEYIEEEKEAIPVQKSEDKAARMDDVFFTFGCATLAVFIITNTYVFINDQLYYRRKRKEHNQCTENSDEP